MSEKGRHRYVTYYFPSTCPCIQPDSGEVGASLATLWKKWLADFEMFITAAGITDHTRKRTLLLYLAGFRVREIFGQLENTGETMLTIQQRPSSRNILSPKRIADTMYLVSHKPTKNPKKLWISTILD